MSEQLKNARLKFNQEQELFLESLKKTLKNYSVEVQFKVVKEPFKATVIFEVTEEMMRDRLREVCNKQIINKKN